MNLHTCHRKWEPKGGGWSLFSTPKCDECCARALLGHVKPSCPSCPPPWEPQQLASVVATLETYHSLDFSRLVEPTAEIRERIDRIVRTLPFRLSAFGLAMSMRGPR